MTTIANLNELFSLGFIQDFEYSARLAALGLCAPHIDGDVVEDAQVPDEPDLAPAEPDSVPVESVTIEEPAIIEPEEEFTPITRNIAPVPILQPRIVPVKRSQRKNKKIITKPKAVFRRRKPFALRTPVRVIRVIRTRECNTHLADSVTEKDLRRERYVKAECQRLKNHNKEIVRNFRAAKKWGLQRGAVPCKIRKCRVDGTESILFQASVVKKNTVLNQKRARLFNRQVLARKELLNNRWLLRAVTERQSP